MTGSACPRDHEDDGPAPERCRGGSLGGRGVTGIQHRKRAMSAVSSEAPQSADLSEATPSSPGAGAGEGAPHEHSGDGAASKDFGPNEWLVDELYQRYLADPGSVDMAWWNFFADYSPPAGSVPRAEQPGAAGPGQPAGGPGHPAAEPAPPPAPGPGVPAAAPPPPGARPAPRATPAPPAAPGPAPAPAGAAAPAGRAAARL